MRNRDFARWFWTDMARDAELVCVERDLHEHFYSDAPDDSLACIYFCNQRIYSARHAAGEPPQLDRVSAAWPLRCAHFRSPGLTPRGKVAFDAWLDDMKSRYRLVSMVKYPLTFWVGEQELHAVAQVELYEFVPKDATCGAGVSPAPAGVQASCRAEDAVKTPAPQEEDVVFCGRCPPNVLRCLSYFKSDRSLLP